jgi:hypothetical protein
MFKGDKYFELMEITKPPEVIFAYRNWNSSLTYPTGLANKDFTLLLLFNSAPIFFRLGVLPDDLLGRRLYDNALMIFKVRYLF